MRIGKNFFKYLVHGFVDGIDRPYSKHVAEVNVFKAAAFPELRPDLRFEPAQDPLLPLALNSVAIFVGQPMQIKLLESNI